MLEHPRPVCILGNTREAGLIKRSFEYHDCGVTDQACEGLAKTVGKKCAVPTRFDARPAFSMRQTMRSGLSFGQKRFIVPSE